MIKKLLVCSFVTARQYCLVVILLKKQQEIQPVITTSGNESAEILIDSGNSTMQSQSIQGIKIHKIG